MLSSQVQNQLRQFPFQLNFLTNQFKLLRLLTQLQPLFRFLLPFQRFPRQSFLQLPLFQMVQQLTSQQMQKELEGFNSCQEYSIFDQTRHFSSCQHYPWRSEPNFQGLIQIYQASKALSASKFKFYRENVQVGLIIISRFIYFHSLFCQGSSTYVHPLFSLLSVFTLML